MSGTKHFPVEDTGIINICNTNRKKLMGNTFAAATPFFSSYPFYGERGDPTPFKGVKI